MTCKEQPIAHYANGYVKICHRFRWQILNALAYTGEAGPGGNEWANQALFDYDGNALPAHAIIRDFQA